jgi:hypothetical protein
MSDVTLTKAEVDAAEKVLADTFDPGRAADCYWRTLAEDVLTAAAEARAAESYERRLSLVTS